MKTVISLLLTAIAIHAHAAPQNLTLHCEATSSWHHEANFKTVVKSSKKWELVSGSNRTYRNDLETLRLLNGRILISVQGYQDLAGESVIYFHLWDEKTKTGSQGAGPYARHSYSFQNPTQDSTSTEPNRVDFFCDLR